MTRPKTRALSAWAAVLLAVALGPAAHAQVVFPDSLDWEAVGEAPHDISGIAFAPDGTLWGVADRIWRLPPGSNVWEEMADRTGHFMLALGPDTLLYAVLDSSTDRSLDDGQTWSFACECGGPLFAADLDGPSRGALLGTVRDDIGIAYSHDRGTTWHRPSFPEAEGSLHVGEAFGEVTAGPHAGRLLSGHLGGLGYSDDRGQTWRASNLWSPFEFIGEAFAPLRDGTVLAGVDDVPPGGGLWASEDGAVWERRYAFFRPDGSSAAARHLAVAGRGTAGEVVYAFVSQDHVFGSADAGHTWAYLGGVYDGTEAGVEVRDVAVGPDGRLYAAVGQAGIEREWVYRTVSPVPVGVAPGASPAGAGSALRVWPNPARGVLHVEGEAGSEAVVYDVLGRELERAHLWTGKTLIDLSGLPAGVYVLHSSGEVTLVTVQQ